MSNTDEWFKNDNPHFDAPKWLDQCSPDAEQYPISELWEGDQLG